MYLEMRPTGADGEYGIWERVPSLECVGRLQLRLVPAERLGYIGGWAVLTPDRQQLYLDCGDDTERDQPGSDDCNHRAHDRALHWANQHLHQRWYGDEDSVPSAFYEAMQ